MLRLYRTNIDLYFDHVYFMIDYDVTYLYIDLQKNILSFYSGLVKLNLKIFLFYFESNL
jgi:hypothetical protein